MLKTHRRNLRHHLSRKSLKVRLDFEPLETRNLPTTVAWPETLQAVAASVPNQVLDQAAPLAVDWNSGEGQLPATAQSGIAGSIDQSPGGGGDVDWYRFTLDRAAHVVLATFSRELGTVLGLYNTDPLDGTDPYGQLGHRLLAQTETSAGDDLNSAPLERNLAAGDYYVAVSGAGNRFFHPFIAESGYSGDTGDYRLLFGAVDLGSAASGLPRVLAINVAPDPVADGAFSRSPLLVRLDLSGPIDPSNLNVQLTDLSASDTLNNLVAGVTYGIVANELRLALTSPLGPGTYQVTLAAQDTTGVPVLDADFSSTFTVTGIEANGASMDDTPGSAHELDVAGGNLVQVTGAIGDDLSAVPFDANDVDLYHFQIRGSGRHALVAETFAGRIGSPLNPGLSLFVHVGDQLHLIALNDDTNNSLAAGAASPVLNPLQADAVLYAGLTAGDYYLAVSGSGNLPDPFAGDFDFAADESLKQFFGGWAFQTGEYVLNVEVRPDELSPEVMGITGLEILAGPPTQFVAEFSETANLRQLAYQTQQNTLAAVFIQGPDGATYSPRFDSYDGATNRATFLMLDRLTPGDYHLHLSGFTAAGAITDVAGNPLLGNDPQDSNGDYVFDFTVTGNGQGTAWSEGANDEQHPQDLGTLAPFDLHDRVTIAGGFAALETDYYQFQVLQERQFAFILAGLPEGSRLPPGNWLEITNTTTGEPVMMLSQGAVPDPNSQVNDIGQIGVLGILQPGTIYVIRISAWATDVSYHLVISNASSNESPPPLTVGAAPAIRIRLAHANTPTPLVLTPPPLTPPPVDVPSAPSGNGGSDRPPSGASPSTVPASVFLALGAGPVGGLNAVPGSTSTTTDVFDRLFAQAPLPGLNQGFVLLSIWSLGTGQLHGEEGWSSPTQNPRTDLETERPWQTALERLLGLWFSPALPPFLVPEASSDTITPGEDQLQDMDDDSVLWHDETADLRNSEVLATAELQLEALAGAYATAGGFAHSSAASVFAAAMAVNLAAAMDRNNDRGLAARRQVPTIYPRK